MDGRPKHFSSLGQITRPIPSVQYVNHVLPVNLNFRSDQLDAGLIKIAHSPERMASPKITVRNIYSAPRRSPSDASSSGIGHSPTSPTRITVHRKGSDIGIGTPVSGKKIYLPKRTGKLKLPIQAYENYHSIRLCKKILLIKPVLKLCMHLSRSLILYY